MAAGEVPTWLALVVGLGSGTIGASATAMVNRGATIRQHRHEVDREERAEKRAAYIAFLNILSDLWAKAQSSVLVGFPFTISDDESQRLFLASTECRLLAPKETWLEMAPYFAAVQYVTNAISSATPAHVKGEMLKHVADLYGPEQVQEFRERFVEAAWSDLRRSER